MLKKTTFKQEQDPGLRYLGIATPLRDYRLCFFLEKSLDLPFRRVQSLPAQSKEKNRVVQFNVFAAGSFDLEQSYPMALFVNRCQNDYFVSGIGKFDFILRLPSGFSNETISDYLLKLKSIPEVVLCAEIPASKIKDAAKLLVEEHPTNETPLRQKRFGS